MPTRNRDFVKILPRIDYEIKDTKQVLVYYGISFLDFDRKIFLIVKITYN